MTQRIDRRNFLRLLAALRAGAAVASTPGALRPTTLDLRQPLRLAVACMTNRMDPAAYYRPWFAVDVEAKVPIRLRHDVWDFGDTSGRFVEGFVTARQMIEPTPEMLSSERRIRRYLNSLIGPAGVIDNPDQKAPDHLFSQGSALYGLVTDYQDDPTPTLRARIDRFIAGLDRLAVHESDYLWFPQVATKVAPCSHMAAYHVLPVTRFYELTHHQPALKYAEALSRWAYYHDPTVTQDGVITKTFWEGHLHAWMDTFSGILRCSRAGGNLPHAEVAERSRRLYEWVRANHTSSFGWVADSVGSKTCETDTITSFIRLALELIKEGHTDYWSDVERFVRNQLVENQFRDLSSLHIQDPQTAQGLRGAFESYADPNTLLAIEKGTVEGCCINGGIRGLYLAYENAFHEDAQEIRVNLLLSTASRDLELVSYMPFEGRVDVHPHSEKPVLVRCPAWLEPGKVEVKGPASVQAEVKGQAHWLRLMGLRAGSAVVLRFEQPAKWQTHNVGGKTYRAYWRGDTVVRIEPAGEPYPIYQRGAFLRDRAPLKAVPLAYRQASVLW